MTAHDDYTRRILHEIERGARPTQRALAAELGIAVGLTNLLIRRLVKKGWVQVVNVNPRRVRYLITPAGLAAKARITRGYFQNTIRLYTETRERIRASLTTLSETWPPEACAPDGSKQVVFYGAGEVAEIGYIGLQQTDLCLVGVVDDHVRTPFFGVPVHPSSDLQPHALAGQPFGRVVVMSFRRAAQIRTRLDVQAIPPGQVFWL